MLLVGRRVIPWLLHYVAHTGSRELFRSRVLAIALGVAYGRRGLFGVSFALGAFFAGMVLSESRAQPAGGGRNPCRCAMPSRCCSSSPSGMLFDPRSPAGRSLAVLATLPDHHRRQVAAAVCHRACASATRSATAVTIAASLAQIGEFSFILASLGVDLHLLDGKARDFILAGSILSIMVNPFLFGILDRRRLPGLSGAKRLAVRRQMGRGASRLQAASSCRQPS